MSDESRFEKAIARMNQMREERGIDIHGGIYSQVKDRVEVFRRIFGSEFGINTNIVNDLEFASNFPIVVKAEIVDKMTGTIVASGHSVEFVGSNHVNSVAPLEACETSAIGRALACFGLHGGEFASGTEMAAIDRKRDAMKGQKSKMEKDEEHFRAERQVISDSISALSLAAGNTPPGPSSQPPAFDIPNNFYIPLPDDPTWDDILACHNNVLATLDLVETEKQLADYWFAIGQYRQYVGEKRNDLSDEMIEYFKSTKNRIIKENENG
jgi:hypothetical protein